MQGDIKKRKDANERVREKGARKKGANEGRGGKNQHSNQDAGGGFSPTYHVVKERHVYTQGPVTQLPHRLLLGITHSPAVPAVGAAGLAGGSPRSALPTGGSTAAVLAGAGVGVAVGRAGGGGAGAGAGGGADADADADVATPGAGTGAGFAGRARGFLFFFFGGSSEDDSADESEGNALGRPPPN